VTAAGTEQPVAGRRVLVTGGAGFIGAHVVHALHDGGADVLVADLRPSRHPGIESVQVDLTDADAIERALPQGVDAVVHLAAATSVLRSVARPAETYAANVAVTAALLERARQTGTGTFLLASTNAVVGAAERLPIDESTPLRPLTPYGATKAAGEMLLACYHSSYDMHTMALRFTNVYGPQMAAKDSIVPRLMRAARTGTTFEVYGDGQQLRDYVFIDDVVAAVLMGLGGQGDGALVIGSGSSTSVQDLIATIQDITGAQLPFRHVAAKAGEMARVVVDISRARSLGWRPAVSLHEGLARVWSSWADDAALAAPDLGAPQAGRG
jgi:UDP-glucose 4-epimerase